MKPKLLACLFALVFSAYPSAARCDQFPDPAVVDARAQEIYGTIMSPYCPGRLLKDCPSSQASELKRSIRGELEAGTEPEVVLQNLERRYGDSISALPGKDAMGLLAWLAPVIFLVLGGIILVTWLMRRRGVIKESPVVADIDPELSATIEKEISK